MRKVLQTTALLLAAMAAGYVGGLLGQARHSAQAQEKPAALEEVRARAFVLVDGAGKMRGSFGLVNGAPVLSLSDAAGKERGAFALLPDGSPGLALCDAAGKPRGAFWMVGREPHLDLYDAAGKGRGGFGLLKNGAPRLWLRDAAGEPIWSAP